MYSTDKIAILLATYNGEKYISEQIDSILEQTNQEWMLFIHDDGSKDRTIEIIETYAKTYPDRICIVEGVPTGGAKQNFFYLFSCVEAPYYMCCDQDDVWVSEKIEITKKEMSYLEKGDEHLPCLVFTELQVVDETLQVLSEKMSAYQGLDCSNLSVNRALIQNVVTGCTMMVNRTLRDEFQKVKVYTDVLMHDWWALLIATHFGKVTFVETPTILYRQHGDNGVGARNANTILYMLRRLLQGEEIKQSLANTRKQAAYFSALYEEQEIVLTKKYANLGNKGKLARWKFYKEHNVKKSTWSKNLGLILWG